MKLKLTALQQPKSTTYSRIAELILRLQEDYKILAEFNKDPDKVMNEAGITREENRKILKSGNLLKVRELINEECGFP